MWRSTQSISFVGMGVGPFIFHPSPPNNAQTILSAKMSLLWNRDSFKETMLLGVGGVQPLQQFRQGDSPDGHLVTGWDCPNYPVVEQQNREKSTLQKQLSMYFLHERNCPAVSSGSDPICIFWWVFLVLTCFCILYLLLPNSCLRAAGLGGTKILKSWHFFLSIGQHSSIFKALIC